MQDIHLKWGRLAGNCDSAVIWKKNAEVKKKGSYTTSPPLCLHGGDRGKFTF